MKRVLVVALFIIVSASNAFCVDYSKETAKYIEAAKKKDMDKLFASDYIMHILRKNFKSYSLKSNRDLFKEQYMPGWSEKGNVKFEYFPPSMKYKVVDIVVSTAPYNMYENKKNWKIANVIIEATYPVPTEAPVSKGKEGLVKRKIMGLSFDGKTGKLIECQLNNDEELWSPIGRSIAGDYAIHTDGVSGDLSIKETKDGKYEFNFSNTYNGGNGMVNVGDVNFIAEMAETITFKNSPDDMECNLTLRPKGNFITVEQGDGICGAGMNVYFGGTYKKRAAK